MIPPIAARKALLSAMIGAVAVVSPPTAHTQRIFLYREPTVCSTPFRPVSGYTFHAQSQWTITWSAPPGSFGGAVYAGYPNPAISVDGTKRWDSPIAFVNCWIDWYLENGGQQAYFEWEVNGYGGEVTSCTGGGSGRNTPPEYLDRLYDPYVAYDSYNGSSCGSGGGGGGDEGGGGCPVEYVVIEISNDGGSTWQTLWAGWATVC